MAEMVHRSDVHPAHVSAGIEKSEEDEVDIHEDCVMNEITEEKVAKYGEVQTFFEL